MYPKLKELKEALKQKAAEIRALKKETKETQKAGGIAGHLQYKAIVERSWYRHRHIVYCLIRGRKYEQIEQPREDNGPNWNLIREIQDEYAKAEDVCAGA